MNAMNELPLRWTVVLTVAVVLGALWICGASGASGPRRSLRRAILALDRIATEAAAAFACLALAVAVAAGVWQVFSRFATETPAVWSEALVRTALIWMAFLGLAVALRTGSLVAIDVAHRYSRGVLRRGLEAAALAANLSFMGVAFWFGWLMAERVRFQEMAGLEVSMSWGYAAIPVGAVFAMIGALAHFLDRNAAEPEALT